MFGVNKKAYYICALISGIIGVLVLGLKVFKVLPDEAMYTLISLIFLMLGFVIYIRPATKLLNIKMNLSNQFRNDLYDELTKGNKYPTEVQFYENENNELQFNNMTFTGLTIEEAKVILISLLSDYVRIIFGVMDEKKKKFIKATIEKFTVEIIKKDSTKLYLEIIKDYKFMV